MWALRTMHFESKILNLSKRIENTGYFKYRIKIRNRNYRSNIVSKFETVLSIYRKKFDIEQLFNL
jgi:hypothetical protein